MTLSRAERIRILSNSQIQLISDIADKEFVAQAFAETIAEAEMMEKVDVASIGNVVLGNSYMDTEEADKLAQAIITYLQQPTEH